MYLKLLLELIQITISKHQNSKPSQSGSCVKPLWWWSQLHLIFYWSASWVNLKDIYKAVVSLDNEHKIKKWKFHSSHVLKTLSVWQAGIWLQPAHFQIPQSSPVRLGSNCDQVFLVNNKAKKKEEILSLCFQCLLMFLSSSTTNCFLLLLLWPVCLEHGTISKPRLFFHFWEWQFSARLLDLDEELH